MDLQNRIDSHQLLILVLALLLLLLVSATYVFGQSSTGKKEDEDKKAKQKDDKSGAGFWTVVPTTGEIPKSLNITTPKSKPDEPVKKKKRKEFVIAPIPVVNPTTGNGSAIGAGRR